MFKNIGKTVFCIGKILFWVFLIAAVALFLIGGMSGGTTMAVILFLSAAVSAFIIALPICGFGKLIMDVSAIREKMDV